MLRGWALRIKYETPMNEFTDAFGSPNSIHAGVFLGFYVLGACCFRDMGVSCFEKSNP